MPNTTDLGKAVLELSTDQGKLDKGIAQAKGKSKDLDKSFKKTTKSLKSFAMGAVAAAAAIAGIVRVIGSALNAYKSQLAAEVKLEAALTATGNAVGLTTGELKDFATELSDATGIADEAVIAAEALMVTFTQVGKEVFPQAIEAAADMSVMFGADLQMSIIQLGTALNDPIAGIGRLKRIGISFTEDQRSSIKTFMDQNDIMSAQKVILDELAVEFGGVARAAGQTAVASLDKLGNAFKDLEEQSGQAVAEGLKPIAEWLTVVLKNASEAQKQIRLVNEALRGAIGTTSDEQQERLNALIAERAKVETSTNSLVRARARTLDNEIELLKATILLTERTEGIEGRRKAEAQIMLEFLDQIGVAEKDITQFNLDRLDPAVREAELLQVQIDRFANLRAQAIGYGEEYAAIQEHINNLVAARDELLAPEDEMDLVGTAIEPWNEWLLLIDDVPAHLRPTQEELEEIQQIIEDMKTEADELEAAIASWLQPLDAFGKQAASALGTLAVEGEAGAEAFGNAMKGALAGVVEALGEMLSVQALAAWAASFVPGGQGNIPSAIAYTSAAAAAFFGAGVIRALARGGDFMTSGPELVMVGDNPGGVEHVQVDPVSSRGQNDDMPIHIQVMLAEGPIIDTVARASRNRTLVIDARSLTTR